MRDKFSNGRTEVTMEPQVSIMNPEVAWVTVTMKVRFAVTGQMLDCIGKKKRQDEFIRRQAYLSLDTGLMDFKESLK